MSQAHGYNSFFAWAQETTYNTPVAAAKWLEIESEALKNTRKWEVRPLLRFLDQSRRIKTPKKVDGTVRFPALWTGWEQLLKHALGSVSTAGVGPYTHTFSLAAALPTGLTAYVNRDAFALGSGSEFRYPGCKIGKMTLSQKMGEFLMVELGLMGSGDLANVAVSAPVYPTFDAIDYAQLTTARINPAGANVALKIREFELSVDNGLVDQRRLGSVVVGNYARGSQRKINWKFEAEFDSLTEYAYFRDLAETDLQFVWFKDANFDLTVTLPRVTFDGQDPESKETGPIYIPFEGTAWVNTADGDPLSIVLKNQTATV